MWVVYVNLYKRFIVVWEVYNTVEFTIFIWSARSVWSPIWLSARADGVRYPRADTIGAWGIFRNNRRAVKTDKVSADVIIFAGIVITFANRCALAALSTCQKFHWPEKPKKTPPQSQECYFPHPVPACLRIETVSNFAIWGEHNHIFGLIFFNSIFKTI